MLEFLFLDYQYITQYLTEQSLRREPIVKVFGLVFS